MYWLIENQTKIDHLCQIKHKEAYVEIIPTSPFLHPVENSICAIYIKPLTDTKGYIIPINHKYHLTVYYNPSHPLLRIYQN